MVKQYMQLRAGSEKELSYRSMAIETRADGTPSTLNEAERSVLVVASTEAPAIVYDWDMGYMTEVLLMSGVSFPPSRQVPLLDSHSRYSTSSVIGSFREIEVNSQKQLIGKNVFSSLAEDIFTKVKEGHLTDVSIGYVVQEYIWLSEGKTQVVEGKTFTGPLKIGTKWSLFELSVVPIGADEFAKVRSAKKENLEVSDMWFIWTKGMKKQLEAKGLHAGASRDEARAFFEKLTEQEKAAIATALETEPDKADSTPPVNSAADAGDTATRAAQEEYTRVTSIRDLCRKSGATQEQENDLCKPGVTVDQAARKLLDFKIDKEDPGTVRSGAYVVADEGDKYRAALTDALSIRAGMRVDKPAAGYGDFVVRSLKDLAYDALVRARVLIPQNQMEMVGRALTTSDFPAVLAEVARKALMVGYNESPETWHLWCAKGSVATFNKYSAVQLGGGDGLEEITENGNYEYGSVSDAAEEYKICTFGKLFGISRTAIINDDLGALTALPTKYGRSARRKIGDIAYAVLTSNSAMSDGKALFHADHKNIGTSGAIGVSNFGDLYTKMSTQTGLDGEALGIEPKYFIAPKALFTSAEQFFKSTLEGTQAKPNQVNPYGGTLIDRIYESRLDTSSASRYYLASAEKEMGVKIFFLNGMEEPYLETRNGWQSDGVEYKVRIDAGAKAMDWRGLGVNTLS